MDAGREMIPLDSDLHQSDPVIIQHIMQMIDTDIFWYGETFRQVITELRKKALHETTMVTGEKLDENAYRESAMMCWESLDESEPTSKRERHFVKKKQRTIRPTKSTTTRTPSVQQIRGLAQLSPSMICSWEQTTTRQRSLPKIL